MVFLEKKTVFLIRKKEIPCQSPPTKGLRIQEYPIDWERYNIEREIR